MTHWIVNDQVRICKRVKKWKEQVERRCINQKGNVGFVLDYRSKNCRNGLSFPFQFIYVSFYMVMLMNEVFSGGIFVLLSCIFVLLLCGCSIAEIVGRSEFYGLM